MAEVDEKVLIRFAQKLAANEKVVRDRTLKKLRKWLQNRSRKALGGFSDDDLLKIWKGLHYCMWMSDKALVQEDLADSLSCLVHCFQDPEMSFQFLDAFFQTEGREWNLIDFFRIDKFMMLIRRCFDQGLVLVKKHGWHQKSIARFLNIFSQGLISGSDDKLPDGLKFHLADLYLTELAKVGAEELNGEQLQLFMDPYCQFLAQSRNKTMVRHVAKNIFEEIVAQAVKAATEEDEEGDDQATKRSRPPRLKFDYGQLGDTLFALGRSNTCVDRNRRLIYGLVKKFKDLAQGILPQKDKVWTETERPIDRSEINRAIHRLETFENRMNRIERQKEKRQKKQLAEESEEEKPKAKKLKASPASTSREGGRMQRKQDKESQDLSDQDSANVADKLTGQRPSLLKKKKKKKDRQNGTSGESDALSDMHYAKVFGGGDADEALPGKKQKLKKQQDGKRTKQVSTQLVSKSGKKTSPKEMEHSGQGELFVCSSWDDGADDSVDVKMKTLPASEKKKKRKEKSAMKMESRAPSEPSAKGSSMKMSPKAAADNSSKKQKRKSHSSESLPGAVCLEEEVEIWIPNKKYKGKQNHKRDAEPSVSSDIESRNSPESRLNVTTDECEKAGTPKQTFAKFEKLGKVPPAFVRRSLGKVSPSSQPKSAGKKIMTTPYYITDSGKKKVLFAMNKNMEQDYSTYRNGVSDSPSVPFDPSVTPQSGILKAKSPGSGKQTTPKQKLFGKKRRSSAADFF